MHGALHGDPFPPCSPLLPHVGGKAEYPCSEAAPCSDEGSLEGKKVEGPHPAKPPQPCPGAGTRCSYLVCTRSLPSLSRTRV